MSASTNALPPESTEELTPLEYVERIGELIKSGEIEDVPYWGDGKFGLGRNGKWHYESFVIMLKALHEAMLRVDPSMPDEGLPPHCLDPKFICWFFRIPLKDMNWQGKSKPELPKVDSPYLTIAEGAAYLRTTVQGIYSLVKRGRLHPMPGRGKLLFTREALDRCMTTRRRRR